MSLFSRVFIMGCLLSRRRQGDGGMETAVPVTAETREMLDIKKNDLFLHVCSHLFWVSVCAFLIHENRHFQLRKN